MRLNATRRYRVHGTAFLPPAALLAAAFAVAATAAPGYVVVHPQTVPLRYDAYARVEAIDMVPLRAAQVGRIARLFVLPGSAVRAGAPLAQLVGPEIRARLIRDRGALHSAASDLATARKSFARERQLLALRLATAQSVADAQSRVAAARAAVDGARAQLRGDSALAVLRAPVAGRVLALNAAAGERVAAGQTVLTLQADGRLWLHAAFYGTATAAIHVGMRGRFVPTTDPGPIPVVVVSVFPTLGADGGESVGLRATGGSPWHNGDFGSVTLDGPSRLVTAVPTRALILDRGRWWVMLRTPHGDRPQAVVPGAAHGWNTLVESGLAPGAEVVVDNAYLDYHRGISRSYQPPD